VTVLPLCESLSNAHMPGNTCVNAKYIARYSKRRAGAGRYIYLELGSLGYKTPKNKAVKYFDQIYIIFYNL